MGVVNHNAIIATTANGQSAGDMLRWIAGLQSDYRSLFVSSGSWVNGYQTIVLVPDGSKEGWPDSMSGDDLRAQFRARLDRCEYDDGSSPWAWVEVGFGEFGQKVLRGNCKNVYSDAEYAE